MAVKANKEIMEAFLEGATEETKKVLSQVDLSDSRDVSDALFNYQVVKNEFISSLINKIFMTQIHSKVWKNPLKIFHGGMEEYGYTIEDMYVEASEKVEFKKHFNSGDEVKDIVSTLVPKVYTNYLSRNFADKYKITISDIQLRTAFRNEYGLANLVNKLLEANLRGAYRDEYKYMKDMFFKYCKGLTNQDVGMSSSPTKTQYIQDSQVIKLNDDTNLVKNLCKSLKAMNKRLMFESDKYNSAKVMQFSSLNDCVFITTPEIEAEIDIEFLADVFNLSKAEVQQRIILMDELPTTIKSGDTGSNEHSDETCIGMLVDKDLLRFKDFVFETRYFNNPNNLSTNYFLHKQGLCGIVPFLNAIIYTKSSS